MKKTTETVQKLKDRVQELKELNLLPKNYAATIADKLGIPKNKVYRTMSGQNGDLDIIQCLLEMAENNREKELLERSESYSRYKTMAEKKGMNPTAFLEYLIEKEWKKSNKK